MTDKELKKLAKEIFMTLPYPDPEIKEEKKSLQKCVKCGLLRDAADGYFNQSSTTCATCIHDKLMETRRKNGTKLVCENGKCSWRNSSLEEIPLTLPSPEIREQPEVSTLEEEAHILTKQLRYLNAQRLGLPLNDYLRTSIT